MSKEKNALEGDEKNHEMFFLAIDVTSFQAFLHFYFYFWFLKAVAQ